MSECRFAVCQQALAFITFICVVAAVHAYSSVHWATPGNLGWASYASISGLISVAVFFIVHIINYFPEATIAYIIVRLMPTVITYQCTKNTYQFKTQCNGDINQVFETVKITVFDPVVCKTPDVPLQNELLY